jgi:LysR family hydrogen peroxide-inducible transcriptional activator
MSIHKLGFRDLKYIIAIADKGSFGRAAEACGITQPALSERVKRIESTLGVSLFERSKRGLQVTPTGDRILRKARELMEQALAIDEITASHNEPLSGPLRLGVIATLGPYLMPQLLPALRQQYPKLELILNEGLTEPLLSKLQAGSLDLVIAAAPLNYAGIIQHELFHEAFVLAAPRGHKLAQLETVNAADLRGNDMVLLEDGHCLSGQALDVCPTKKGQNRDRLHAMSLETLRHMVAAGTGYTLLPALAVGEQPPLTDLISYVRLQHEEQYGRTITLAYRKSFSRASDMKLLAKLTREVMAEGRGISMC